MDKDWAGFNSVERGRALQAAEDFEKFEPMLRMFGRMETEDELKRCAMMFIQDLSYPRSDICLAIKTIEKEHGWGQYAPAPTPTDGEQEEPSR